MAGHDEMSDYHIAVFVGHGVVSGDPSKYLITREYLTAQRSLPHLKSGNQMSTTSAKICMASEVRYMLLFHRIGTLTEVKFRASRIM